MPLPSCLDSKTGWSALLEAKRTREPHIHQIEPTNRCAYQCVMCPRDSKMTRPQGLMEMALYRKIITEIAGYSANVKAREIELFHFGESLLHPDLPEMVRFGAERGLKMTLSVNPPHLSPTIADALLAAGPHRIIVSLDGDDEDTYRQIRGKAARFAQAVDNLRHLIARAREYPQVRVVIRAIRMHANAGQIEAMRQRWEREGATFEARPFFPWTEQDIAGLGTFERYPPNMPCPFPWQYLVVQWDGTVVPCCRDYNAANPVGNARTQSLIDIWNGEDCRQFRRQHETGEFGDNHFCRDCSALYCR